MKHQQQEFTMKTNHFFSLAAIFALAFTFSCIYERGQNSAENEQNLITILNSLNDMAQEYQSKQK